MTITLEDSNGANKTWNIAHTVLKLALKAKALGGSCHECGGYTWHTPTFKACLSGYISEI